METYNENKHRDLIVNHIKESLKSGLELDMPHIPPRNDGTPLVCIVLNEEGHSIVMESEEFGMLYYNALYETGKIYELYSAIDKCGNRWGEGILKYKL